ncbi:MAG TPA: hypothetical protein VKT54_11575 [Steroidobacteraceae bacterium]|nr:hypothetical protein [Steroidobacteraceae bacterium]
MTPPADAAARWDPLHPREASALLSHLPSPWWVAGGWAIDLFLGHQGRPHKDLDIGILRGSTRQTLAAMPDWEFFEASGGILSGPLAGDPRPNVNSLWGRPRHTRAWRLELMLDDSDGEQWIFRRDRSVRRALSLAIRRDGEGIPYLAPEIQLLYKASGTRAEDEADFTRAAPRLSEESRRWLGDALARAHPQHPWRSVILPAAAAAPAR